MPLDITPVHRNLLTRPTFLWLEFEDWFVVIGLAAAMNIVTRWIFVERVIFGMPLNMFLQFAVPLLAIPFLTLFKYGKPRGYLMDLLLWYMKPQVYSGHEGDSEQTGEYLFEEGGDDAAGKDA